MKNIKVKRYILLTIIIWIAIANNFSFAEENKEKYQPYPIIFVHGIDPGSWKTFKDTRDKLNEYFYTDEDGYEYFHTNKQHYFPFCQYSNNRDIKKSAINELETIILMALKHSFPSEVPESERKVIIVAHSMGGLVVRSLLYQEPDYKDKIDKVIFLGTPHLGAPSASVVWSLNEVYDKVLGPMVKDYFKFFSQSVGSRRIFADKSSIMIVDGLIYDKLSSQIQTYRNQLWREIFNSLVRKKVPNPDGIALEQLRLAGDVSYHKVFEKAYKNKKQDITIDLSIDGTKTFLGKSSQHLSNPKKYFSIIGSFDYENVGWLPAAWGVNILRNNYESDFNKFPTFDGVKQSISNAIKDGDGVVTTQSQLGIEPKKGSYTIISAHHTQEASNWQTILQAIEDKPEIERIYAIAVDETQRAENMEYYIVVKVKDYLLADIEIEEMTLNGSPVDPGFKDNKPYNAYPDKEFLKSRKGPKVIDIDGNEPKLDLEPGEFFVKKKLHTGTNEFRLKIKNPAEKYANDGSFTDEVIAYLCRPKITDLYFVNDDGPSDYDWQVDVPPYDTGENPRAKYGTLQEFTITDEKFQNMLVEVWLFKQENGKPSKTPTKKLEKNGLTVIPVTLGGTEGSYTKTFIDFTTWDGTNEAGAKVPQCTWYKIRILAKATTTEDPLIDRTQTPAATKQLLLSTNWDTSGQDLIFADPTFIQHSREINLNFCSRDRQSSIESKLSRCRQAIKENYEKHNHQLASHLEAIGAKEEVLVKVNNSPSYNKHNLNLLANISNEF